MIKIVIENRKKSNDLLMLTFLSLISMAIIFHRIYDFIVLIFPLWYILSGRAKNKFFIIIMVGLIALIWFIIPAFNTLSDLTDSPIINFLKNIVEFTMLITFYLSIFVSARLLKEAT